LARRRRLVPVAEDIVEQLADIARRSGLTIPELAETILGQAVRVLRGRDDVAGVLADAVILADIARLGGSPVPLRGLGLLLDNVGEEEARRFIEEATGLARLVAVSARARGVDQVTGVVSVLRSLFPGAAVDLVEDDRSARVVLASPLFVGRLLRLAEASASAVVEGFGAELLGRETEPGLVVVKYKPRRRRVL